MVIFVFAIIRCISFRQAIHAGCIFHLFPLSSLQICREDYPRPVCLLLWMLSEASIIALDLTMVRVAHFQYTVSSLIA